MSENDFDAVIAVNLKGVFLTCQTAAEQMVQQVSATQADLLVALCGVQDRCYLSGGLTFCSAAVNNPIVRLMHRYLHCHIFLVALGTAMHVCLTHTGGHLLLPTSHPATRWLLSTIVRHTWAYLVCVCNPFQGWMSLGERPPAC